tara:strand:+ start:356 stop:691 length:336 start_codon:yes stop_codon:yes gene_type:complete
MANLQLHRAHESLNIETAANWNVQTRKDISSQAHIAVNITTASQIGFYSDSDIYIRFDTSDQDTISTTNDLIIDGEGLVFFNVPRDIGEKIFVHFKQVTSASSKYVRLVFL